MEHYTYDRILVPTDLSDFATLALRYAAEFRERLGSAITLLYADEISMPYDMLEAPIGYYLENAPLTRERLQARFDDYAHAHLGGTYETSVVQDSPSRAILNAAKTGRADLIIMGTHGRSGIRRTILGSVTENVLRGAGVPVLTVTPRLMDVKRHARFARILCPVNFTRVARAALEHASVLAETFDAELTVMYVVEGLDQQKVSEVESAFRHWIDPRIANRCRFSSMVVRDGDPAERVLAIAGSTTTDLIVIGAQHRFFSDTTVVGTTSERITRFARCPVLTIARKAQVEIASDRPAAAALSVPYVS
ncbi:MAG TPA: universal stress protein [Thermoanaerobaculia bacterium]|nr:universal stress protein [Thermoanaerobaculia bacterium]